MQSNPFASRFTRPGALPFLFPAGLSAQSIVAELAQAQWWGEIVGPHGSGKSTLVATLIPELAQQGRRIVHLTFRADGPARGAWPLTPELWDRQTLVVVDGYEQLSWWNRRKLKHACRQAGAGLLITTHRSSGLAMIFRTRPNLELAEQIVRQLLSPGDQTITSEDLRKLCRQHPTNLREVLFGLYDLYRERRL